MSFVPKMSRVVLNRPKGRAVDAHRVNANGIDFATLQAGPVDGPLVLLLHGFPELARSWRHQLPALAAAGYRAVAPDLRGYGETELRGPYDLGTLAADVEGLVHALGHERATLVGHDWGAVVAWSAAARVPHVVERLAALNGPPLPALAAEIRHNPRQARRSAYIAYFNLPVLPERTLTRDGGAFAARALVGGSHVRTAWTREELAPYTAALARPGRAAAALGYYRQAFRHGRAERQAFRRSPVACPVLVVWGLEDRFIGLGTVSAARLRPCLAPGNEAELRVVEDAGHFVQNEAPEHVNQELLRWLPRLR
jgi:pimeloyl-ACP methyl ester carboxylesterase